MYLGHHWAVRRETGETQSVYNYYRAFTEYIINFTFGRGVQFRSPKETEAIVPDLLKRIWEVDNNKHTVLREMGQQGGVSGDCFVKVAYEEAYVDAAGAPVPGRVRILPLNSSHCFPEFHPHDRERLIRFKLKYRFWGCVDTQTEALTRHGWKRYDELSDGDEILSLNPKTNEITWLPATVSVYDYDGHMVRWSNHIDAVTTPNHRWLVERHRGRNATSRYEREIARTEFGVDGDSSIKDLRKDSRVVVGGGIPRAFASDPTLADEVVETLAWYICEGTAHTNQNGYRSGRVSQSEKRYPEKTARIRALAGWWDAQGGTFTEGKAKANGVVEFYLGKGVFQTLDALAPNKRITPEFITRLTVGQARLFYETLLDADGCRTHGAKNNARWTQLDDERKDMFQMLAAMLGLRSVKTADGEKVQVYARNHINSRITAESAERVYLTDGKIWCPSVDGGVWFARRNGSTYWTGNTSPEGTRQVYTYTELLTEDRIEEYINDEIIDSRPNPLGVIPVVHIPNTLVSGSPWGLSDCNDIINLNRTFNEVSCDVADIINYHAAPVTIITGAKASQLEKGAKKVWGGLPKDANVFNLEGGAQGLESALKYLELLKRSMHEMIGIPETALGQVQPISNTSGVALSIQFQPLMNRWQQKIAQYGRGLERINAIALRQLFLKEPETLVWDEATEVPLKDGQVAVLDPEDPISYRTITHFPPPLPLDKLVVLNEIQALMSIGLESKEGALRTLGEEFPEEKLTEIRNELLEDARADGALSLLRTIITKEISELTGMMPTPDGGAMPNEPTLGAEGQPLPSPTPVIDQDAMKELTQEANIRNYLVTAAYGTKLPQRSNPDRPRDD